MKRFALSLFVPAILFLILVPASYGGNITAGKTNGQGPNAYIEGYNMGYGIADSLNGVSAGDAAVTGKKIQHGCAAVAEKLAGGNRRTYFLEMECIKGTDDGIEAAADIAKIQEFNASKNMINLFKNGLKKALKEEPVTK